MADDDKQDEKTTETKDEPKIDAPTEAKADTKPEPAATDKPADEPKTKAEPKAELSKEFKDIVEKLDSLSALEVSKLVKQLEEHWGVSAAAPVAVAVPAGPGEPGAPAAAEKSEFDVTLKDAGSQKVAVIKAVKDVTGLGLGEAKAIVDGVPKVVKEKVARDEAEQIKQTLEAAGAVVELS